MATKTKKELKSWTADEINQLWNGPLKDVASKLGRSTYAVSVARGKYKRFKPGNKEGLTANAENVSMRKAGKSNRAEKPKRTYTKRAVRQSSNVETAPFTVNGAFKMTFNNQKLEFQSTPKMIRIDNDRLEVDF